MIPDTDMKLELKLIGLVLCMLPFISCKKELKENNKTQVKNVILLVGDGMGLSQVSTAFYYKEDQPNFERFKSIGLIKTSSASHLITDSAAGATAFSSGVKTYNASIGMDVDTVATENIVEKVSELGMKTGLIATSSITHATPASFYAHVKLRSLNEEIASWLHKSEIDYFAGGGLKFFTKRKDSINHLNLLKDTGFTINTKWDTIGDEQTNTNTKYGYLLADDALPKISEGRGEFLKEATNQATSFLSKSDKGFFLLIEGSQIDWGGHNNDSQYIINETIDFDKAIGEALDFAEKDGNTLVIVTADHETGGFTLSASKKEDENGGLISDYNTLEPSFSTKGHSSTLIPVFAYGPGSEDFEGVYENNEIFEKIVNRLDR